MKKQIIQNTLLTIALTISFIFVQAQSCTQCDNTGDPPGNYASEVGQNTTAQGECSFAGGVNSLSQGGYSFAFGNSAQALSHHSFAMGALTTTDGSSAFALGKYCTANGNSSFVLGAGLNSSNILTNSIGYSLMVGFSSDRPTFFVGESSGTGTTGKVGIGDVTNPQAKLHIKADDGEQAALFIEPNVFSTTHDAELWMGTTDYGLRAAAGKMYFNTGGNYIFNSTGANMGIGVILPTEKLEVAGNIKQSAGYYVSTDKVQATGTEGLSLYNHNSTGIFVSPDGNIGIGISNTPYRLTVNGTIFTNSDAYIAGDVGIGTDSPQEKLHVSGNQLITGSLDVNGTVNAGSFSGDGSGLTNVDDGDWTMAGNNLWYLGGDVGIGTTSPNARLGVSGNLRLTGMLAIGTHSPGYKFHLKTNDNTWATVIENNLVMGKGLKIKGSHSSYSKPILQLVDIDDNVKFTALANGNVGIGTSSPDAELDVIGEIMATSLTVGTFEVEEFTTDYLTVLHKIEAGEIEVKEIEKWKDEVFEENYPLLTLSEVEQYIKENKHLPDIPSEAEVLENGINVGEMNALLLQKIEELTLYVIELEKKIQTQK